MLGLQQSALPIRKSTRRPNRQRYWIFRGFDEGWSRLLSPGIGCESEAGGQILQGVSERARRADLGQPAPARLLQPCPGDPPEAREPLGLESGPRASLADDEVERAHAERNAVRDDLLH